MRLRVIVWNVTDMSIADTAGKRNCHKNLRLRTGGFLFIVYRSELHLSLLLFCQTDFSLTSKFCQGPCLRHNVLKTQYPGNPCWYLLCHHQFLNNFQHRLSLSVKLFLMIHAAAYAH